MLRRGKYYFPVFLRFDMYLDYGLTEDFTVIHRTIEILNGLDYGYG